MPPLLPIKAVLFLLCLLPGGWLLLGVIEQTLGANPVETIQRWTGLWTLNLLALTLCITPLRALTQWHWLTRLRRMLGLFCFAYGVAHLLAFIGFDHAFVPEDIARDILKRPFVTVGFAAFALLIPLALTSNQFSIRRLGGRRWQEIHRSIYLIAILGCVHYFWLSKPTQILWPMAYSLIFGLLLGWRLRERQRKAQPRVPTAKVQPIRFFRQRPDQ